MELNTKTNKKIMQSVRIELETVIESIRENDTSELAIVTDADYDRLGAFTTDVIIDILEDYINRELKDE